MVLGLSFCTDLEIPHFFCELNQMLQLVCPDNFLNDMVIYIHQRCWLGVPLLASCARTIRYFPPFIESHQFQAKSHKTGEVPMVAGVKTSESEIVIVWLTECSSVSSMYVLEFPFI